MDLGVPRELQGSTFSLRSSVSAKSLSLFSDLTSMFSAYDQQNQRDKPTKTARYLQPHSPMRGRPRDASPPPGSPQSPRARLGASSHEGFIGVEPCKIHWTGAAVSGPDSTPRPRAGATLSRIGVGNNALLVLFGGYEGSYDSDILARDVRIFDPIQCKWSLAEEIGVMLRGNTPPPRSGHSASALGRHVLIYFGGQTDDGVTSDVFALVQHRFETSANPRSCALTWTQPTIEPGPSPMARMHPAAAEMGDSVLVFGGEVRVRAKERDQMLLDRRADQPALPPLNARAEVGLLSASASAPSLILRSPRNASTASLNGRAMTAMSVGGRAMTAAGRATPGTRGMSRPKSKAVLLRPIQAAPPIAEREAPTAASRGTGTDWTLRKQMRMVTHALADLWCLKKNAKNRLQWHLIHATGEEPPPRSRASLVGLADRGLALLFGGRSIRASVVLNDAYVLDVAGALWTRIVLCGVPPKPREGASAIAFGPGAGVLIMGGKGHVPYSDMASFSVGAHMRSGQAGAEMGSWSADFKANEEPLARHGHCLARLGTSKVVVFGGEIDDLGMSSMVMSMQEPPALLGDCAHWALSMSLVTVSSVTPARVRTAGGDSILIRGSGYRSDCSISVRFSAPQALPTSAKVVGALKFAEDDMSRIVDAYYVDQGTIRCDCPDMLDVMCDGHVLVEVCMLDPNASSRDEWWSTDEVTLEVASEPSQIVSIRPLGGRLSTLPVCTRYTRKLRAADDLGRRPLLELPLEVKMSKKGAPAEPPPPPPKPGQPPHKPTCEASLIYLGEGTYELVLWTEQMGAFDIEISSAMPVAAAPAKKGDGDEAEEEEEEDKAKVPEAVPLVYARFTITATPGPTHPPSCVLQFSVDDEQDAEGNLSLIAGNTYPFTVAKSDHVGNAVDGLDKAWTWRCEHVSGDSVVDGAPPAKPVVFKPGVGDKLQLLRTGTYTLYVQADDDLVPALKGTVAKPVTIVVSPAALSPVHSTFYGSGLHSRYPDMPEDKQDSSREIVVVARDAFGNRLGYSPPWLLGSFSVTLQPTEEGGGPSVPPIELAELGDGGVGVVRAVHPILELGHYALTVSLRTEVLVSKTVMSGTGKDRPKGAPHWSEEEAIYAAESSVAAERAEEARQSLAAIGEQNAKLRFQRQFQKKGKKGQPAAEAGPESPKRPLLNASEIFSVVDEDGSGAISYDEMKTFMVQRGYDGDEIDLTIKRLDTDGDGEISKAEFVAGLQNAESDPSIEDLLRENEAPDAVFDSVRKTDGCEVLLAERRAVTLEQLKYLYLEQVVRRCAAEGWIGRRQDSNGNWKYARLTSETVNMYDLCAYVLVPATAPRQCSYMELVSSGEQVPDWVVSTPWQLPLHQLIQCLEVHAKDTGLTEEGGKYWISAVSNNQHELAEAIPADPTHSTFYKAMALSSGLVSIVDDGAECFSRVWCNYEAWLGVSMPPSPSFRTGYYTAMAHEYREDETPGAHVEMRAAVGLIEGRARDVADLQKDETLAHRLRRERPFPTYLLEAGMSDGAAIELGESSRPSDRTQLLHSLAGSGEGAAGEPPATHAKYDEANAVLRGRLATAALNEVLANATADGVMKRGRFLEAIRNGKVKKLDVSVSVHKGKPQLKAFVDVLDSADPSCIEELRIGMCTELGREDAILRQDELEPLPPPMAPKELERLLELMQLTSLSLYGATNLEAVPPLSYLMRLQELDLRQCASLVALPDDVCDLKDLRRLLLSGCKTLVKLPNELGGTLDEIDAAKAAADAAETAKEQEGYDERLASPVEGSRRLEHLELIGCTGLKQMPDLSTVFGLKVDLAGCDRELSLMWEAAGRKPFFAP